MTGDLTKCTLKADFGTAGRNSGGDGVDSGSKFPERCFFDEHQWETIEAAMDRIIPEGDGPGAREAGTIHFLDRYLSGIDSVFARPDGSGFVRLEGKRAAAWQMRINGLRGMYTSGVEEMDRRANERHGAPFAHLPPDAQDDVLQEMESLRPEWDQQLALSGLSPVDTPMQQSISEGELSFFHLLVLHTRQGFYADPIYGGNREHAGWRLIGFDGPASLAEVHSGRYSTLAYFAEGADGAQTEA